jgi:hypothetical protein
MEPYAFDKPGCSACGTRGASATIDEGALCRHALVCNKQHQFFGMHTSHTIAKRTLQDLMRCSGIRGVLNEQETIFLHDGHRADSTVPPGAMMLATSKELRAGKGVCIDNRVCAPVADEYVAKVRRGAWGEDGFAAKHGEAVKDRHYEGSLDLRRWVLVPFVQECFGRLGRRAMEFVREIAAHSAGCRGGGAEAITARRAAVARHILVTLSVAMARCAAERVLAFVRVAAKNGVGAVAASSALD